VNPPPTAFISHASEDKERFVTSFAKNLRLRGVEAWLDKWEIRPGDSLVDRIFEEGIKKAQNFIVVLSSISVTKSWVREELDAGMVKKIGKSCRLIPIVIDDCEVPQSLRHLLWVRISDLNSYEAELSDIVNVIFGLSDKPEVGPSPIHSNASPIEYVHGLNKADNLVFAALAKNYVKIGRPFIQMDGEVLDELRILGMSDEEISDSLEVLGEHGAIELQHLIGGKISGIRLRTPSLNTFLQQEFPDYERHVEHVMAKIVNENLTTNATLALAAGLPAQIVNHIMDMLEWRGFVKVIRTIGGGMQISYVSPQLRRALRN
jgi:hypothetical protein